jgi:uncharacterized surface protein with fasciclin (FAS1) repeats
VCVGATTGVARWRAKQHLPASGAAAAHTPRATRAHGAHSLALARGAPGALLRRAHARTPARTALTHACTPTPCLPCAGLADTLQSGNFTVFAPTDAAFAKLPAGTVDGLLKDKKRLSEILCAPAPATAREWHLLVAHALLLLLCRSLPLRRAACLCSFPPTPHQR